LPIVALDELETVIGKIKASFDSASFMVVMH
jgi:hypothetical protein